MTNPAVPCLLTYLRTGRAVSLVQVSEGRSGKVVGRQIAKGCLPFLPPFQMGNQPSCAFTPLDCILKHWDRFDPQTLKKRCLTFFCSEVWPQNKLEDGETWPLEESINYSTVLQLDLFCRQESKWSEVPYVQVVFTLRDNPELCQGVRLIQLFWL